MDLIIKTTFHHRQMLRLIAHRGGEVDFKFGAEGKYGPAADASIHEMRRNGLIDIVPIVGTERHMLRLTDTGRAVVDALQIPVKEV